MIELESASRSGYGVSGSAGFATVASALRCAMHNTPEFIAGHARKGGVS